MATLTALATAYTQYSTTVTNPSNAYTNTTSSTYASLAMNNFADTVNFSNFDFSSIPAGSVINSVTFKIKIRRYSGTASIDVTAKINNTKFASVSTTSSTAVVLTLTNTGTPTLAQLKAAVANNLFQIMISTSAAMTIYVYGMEIIVDYTPVYAITASAGANGSISPSGTVNVNSGANQTFTITPDSGYELDALTVDGSSASPTTTTPTITYVFTNVTTTHTISVTFKSSFDPKPFFYAQYKQMFGGM